MKPGIKGLIAVSAFGLVHAGIIAAGAAVVAADTGTTAKPQTAHLTSSAAPAIKPAPQPAPAPAATAPAQQAAQTQPAAAAPPPAQALEERRFALTFLTDLANGNREDAYGKLARETRDNTTFKVFDKAFAPVSDLGLQQVTWGKITQRRAVTSYTSATGYTKSPSITALVGTATSASGPVRIEFTLVETPEGWLIQHFRFKTERRQKLASR